jgi:cell division protease FtsH
MSENVGLVHYAQRQPFALPGLPEGFMQRDSSEETAHQIDVEVRKILDEAYQGAQQILREHRAELDRVADELLKRETLDAQAFRGLLESEKTRAHSRAGSSRPDRKRV